jgi:alcohol dehydrogenase (cytochrome c)
MKRLFLLLALAAPIGQGHSQVTYQRITDALKEQQNWLTYWGDYSAIRFRNLDQISPANVKSLRTEWIYQTGVQGLFETTPLVVDGIMYFTAASGSVYALDARSGRELWHQKYFSDRAQIPAVKVNRGAAILGGRLYMVTPDSYLLALDIRTGHLVWKSQMAPSNSSYYATEAPLAVKDKIVVGIAGGDEGTRGFIDGYDAANGKRVWRFWTIPAKGEPDGDSWSGDSWKLGGGAPWLTGTFDPKLNTLYWGIGNPGPVLSGEDRLGDNLYTASLVALDPDTGKLKWHYQFTPHDIHDWDACQAPVLLDLKWKGRGRKVVVQANRNGFFYVLDRDTGEFLAATPFARQTWAKGFDPKGRPIRQPRSDPSAEGNRVCPGVLGATNWMAPSYNPRTGLFYFAVRERCDVLYSAPAKFVEGRRYFGGAFEGVSGEEEWGLLKALDPLTGETKWDFRYQHAPWAGTLASGGLVFAGDEDGYLIAFDAAVGKVLWRFNTGNKLISSPITYMVGKRQYIAMPSGSALIAFALPQ